MTTKTLKRASIAIITLHLLVGVVHSLAHSALQIYMATWQNAYILVVITVLPLVAAFLLWRRSRLAFLLLFISMLGSLIFGGYYHFVAAGPDNVSELDQHAWTFPFQLSAILLAVLEGLGTLVGVAGLSRTRNAVHS
ncbi:MAG TPA: hypothetical protein VJM12_19640 [Pyrinomonadaceae bacterium]|nr:hypothetical protein [Pyrinomonadaceae bacterium]